MYFTFSYYIDKHGVQIGLWHKSSKRGILFTFRYLWRQRGSYVNQNNLAHSYFISRMIYIVTQVEEIYFYKKKKEREEGFCLLLKNGKWYIDVKREFRWLWIASSLDICIPNNGGNYIFLLIAISDTLWQHESSLCQTIIQSSIANKAYAVFQPSVISNIHIIQPDDNI